MSTTTKQIVICHECGVEEGFLHKPGCATENCPRCGKQLPICSCWLDYIPIEIQNSALDRMSAESLLWWWWRVEKYGRVPFIYYPNICSRCGTIDPDFFKVTNEEWRRYIEPAQRDAVICQDCYTQIKAHINRGHGNAG